MVFRENHYDMSVGVVNITQRKYDKDTLYLLHYELLNLSEGSSATFTQSSHKRKGTFREQSEQM